MQLVRFAFVIVCSLTACRGEGGTGAVRSPASPAPSPASPSPSSPPVGPAPAAHAGHHPGHHPGHSWDDIYRNGTGFRLAPNRLLVDSVHGVAPGKALDIDMGQGRNAVYLASQGWDVTGVDTSAEGVRIAGEQAAAAGRKLNGLVQDIQTFEMGTSQWNLIAMIYMDDRALAERIKAALAPGGLVVIEFFHSDSNDYFPHPINGFHTGELEQLFHGFTVIRSEVVQDTADFGQKPAKLVRFIARKPAA